MNQRQFDQDRRQKIAEKKLLNKKLQKQKFRAVVDEPEDDDDYLDYLYEDDFREFDDTK